MTDSQQLLAKIRVRERTLKEASEGCFLDGVFRAQWYNRWDCGPIRAGAIDLAKIYPEKSPQELHEAVARVKGLCDDALECVAAIVDKRAGGKERLRNLPERHPGFSNPVYDLAINDAFIAMR